MRSLQFLLILSILLSGGILQSQDDQFVAYRNFESGDYKAAIKTYRDILTENPKNEEAMIMMAESLRMSGQISEAVEWYGKVADHEKPAKAFLFNYAKSLQELGYYDKAKNWFLKYAEIDPVKGMHFALSCEYALQEELRSDGSLEITSYSEKSANHYWPVLNGENIIFWSSSSEGNFTGRQQSGWYAGNVRDWKTQLNICETETMTGLNAYNGPASIHNSGELIALTKSINNITGIDATEGMELYIGKRNSASGSFDVEAFPFNVSGYSTTYPYWSTDDGALYFASNRPGGFGGFDLYVSYYENGVWTYPQNLGERLNSQGNEIAPVYKDGTIYFSSDWHTGFGGYDIFKSDMKGFSYGTPVNMGLPINSPKNEWGLQFDDTYTFGVYNSDRNREGEAEILHLQYTHESSKAVANQDIPVKVEPIALLPQRNIDLDLSKEDNFSAAMFTSYSTPIEDKLIEHTEKRSENLTEAEEDQDMAFFIQVAALSKSKGNIDQFRPLSEFGNVYRVESNGMYKIRIGVFKTMGSAVEMLRKVKSAGYNDAYITQEVFNSANLDLIISGIKNQKLQPKVAQKNEITEPTRKEVKVSEKVYKVRLTAYHYNTQFDTRSVNDLGEIEQWTKGTWKIILLGGYKSMSEAKTALMKAKARGYKDAYLVVEEDGLLLPYEEE